MHLVKVLLYFPVGEAAEGSSFELVPSVATQAAQSCPDPPISAILVWQCKSTRKIHCFGPKSAVFIGKALQPSYLA